MLRVLTVEELTEMAKRWDHPEVARITSSHKELHLTLQILRELNIALVNQRNAAYTERDDAHRVLVAYREAGRI